MPDTFIPSSEVEFLETLVCDRYKVKVPRFLAEAHEWWGHWERERFASMEQHLHAGDVLFDIGAETGWQSAIYAQFVGAKNMCLFEPVPEVWPAIRATWEANELPPPKMASCTLVGNENVLFPSFHIDSWPTQSNAPSMLTNVKYRHIDEHGNFTPQTKVDRVVFHALGVNPKALTIDVEGAELLVLQGAEETLRDIHPLVWVSLHEGLQRPGVDPKNHDVHNFMVALGYKAEVLATDHETHVLFT